MFEHFDVGLKAGAGGEYLWLPGRDGPNWHVLGLKGRLTVLLLGLDRSYGTVGVCSGVRFNLPVEGRAEPSLVLEAFYDLTPIQDVRRWSLGLRYTWSRPRYDDGGSERTVNMDGFSIVVRWHWERFPETRDRPPRNDLRAPPVGP